MRQLLAVRGYRDLRRTIGIEDTCLRGSSTQFVEQTVGIFLTATHDNFTLADSLNKGWQLHILQHTRRCSIDGIGSRTTEQIGQQSSVRCLFLTGNDSRLSVAQCTAKLLHRHVERQGGDTKESMYRLCQRMDMSVCWMTTIEVVHDTLVAQHHTLRLTRRTAGVDEVTEILRSDADFYWFAAERTVEQFFYVDGIRELTQTVGSGDDICCMAVAEDVLYALRGIFGVARDIGTSRLHHTEDR